MFITNLANIHGVFIYVGNRSECGIGLIANVLFDILSI